MDGVAGAYRKMWRQAADQGRGSTQKSVRDGDQIPEAGVDVTSKEVQ